MFNLKLHAHKVYTFAKTVSRQFFLNAPLLR
jgi:hypothetical protein